MEPLNIEVNISLSENGVIDIKASTPNLALVLLVMEKAKLKMLDKISLKSEDKILIPRNGIN